MDTHNFLCFGNLLWAENLKSVLWQRTSNISSFKQKFAPFLNSEFFLQNSVSPPSVQSSVSAIMRISFSPWMFSRISTVSVFIHGFHPVVCNCFTTPPPVLPSPLMRKCWTGCVSMLTGPCDFFFVFWSATALPLAGTSCPVTGLHRCPGHASFWAFNLTFDLI